MPSPPGFMACTELHRVYFPVFYLRNTKCLSILHSLVEGSIVIYTCSPWIATNIRSSWLMSEFYHGCLGAGDSTAVMTCLRLVTLLGPVPVLVFVHLILLVDAVYAFNQFLE